MAFPGSIYAPPGVYTQTNFEDPLQGISGAVRIPLLIGTGSEILTQVALELVRGSSSNSDPRVVDEDETGRAVSEILPSGQVVLTDFDGSLDRIQVRNFPITTGDGSATTATNSANINVTINGTPVVILSVDGARGILRLGQAPKSTDVVRATYFFSRTDTLITDTVSDQVTPDAPLLYGEVGQNYVITTDVNDTLSFLVDDASVVNVTISASPSGGWTAAQVAAFINSAATGTSLSASSVVNNFGQTVLSLTADRDVTVQAGTANSTLGLSTGATSGRNKVFFTFQRPIVDGSNGGITTTDPADVTVKVNGTQVIPTAVDGQTGAVTLPFAPEISAVVTVQYYFNSWQDTFDYLANRGVTDITQCGITPDRNDYIEGADFVLKDDKILWGTATVVEAGETTSGATLFENQVTSTLVDVRQYLAACAAVVDTSVSPAVENRKDFTLPLQPTTGNGRNTPITGGSTTYQTVANGRIDLPTNRPDLVWAYWGFSLQDALDRGRVTVTKVDSDTNQITLQDEVPTGATVYATFYYNTVVDQEYTLTSVTPGSSGVGVYSIANEDGASLLTPLLGTKSAALSTVTLQFPSGSERLPDVRFETPFTTTSFTGSVEEDVTVTFASQDATLAKFSVPSADPYYLISGQSDHLAIEVDGAVPSSQTFIDLQDPLNGDCGFHALLVGDEIAYEAGSGLTTFTVDSTNNAVDLEIDGVLIQSVVNASATADSADVVSAINQAAFGIHATASAGALNTLTIPAASNPSDQADYYVGWRVRVYGGTGSGDDETVTAYNESTGVITVASGTTYDGTSQFHLHDPDTLPYIKGATRFLNPVVITASEYDQIQFKYTGVGGAAVATLTATLAAATYSSASTLVTAVQSAINSAISGAGEDFEITVAADSNARLQFTLLSRPEDTDAGVLEFVTGTAARDFCILAGLDTSTALGGQSKLVTGPIARAFSFTGATTGQKVNDRIVLRNRIVPGNQGSQDGQFWLDQCQLKVLGGTGASLFGLTANEEAQAGIQATVMAPTLSGEIGLADGQDAAGMFVLTLYADGGTTAQNNVFKFTAEGTPITIEFTDSAGNPLISGASADVPLGPISDANSIVGQISAALTAASSTVTVKLEGAGLRFRGGAFDGAASIVIGDANANSALGFTEGDAAFRSTLSVEALVSAMMARTASTMIESITDSWPAPASNYYAGEALAKTITDDTNAKYLFIQSKGTAGAGTTSSVAFADAAASNALRPGGGLGVVDGDGNTGEAAIEGFYVTSSDSVNGSGTANTSALNSGTGQDGQVGQTYRDLVTGLTFTLLAREGGSAYPAGATFTFTVRANVTTDSNLPINTLPGVALTVSETTGVPTGDTSIVATYDRGGAEPSVGDVYYVSYQYAKQDFSTALFTQLAAIEAAYGANSPQNPVTLASYLTIVNGAVVVAVKQVQKDTDTDSDGTNDEASEAAFIAAIDDVAGAMPGGAYPDYLVPLKGDSLTLFQYLARHCDIQSSIRYRAERTAIVGESSGTGPSEAGADAQAVGRSRLRMVYPDIYTLSLTTFDGQVESFLVDGTYIAAAVAGTRADPSIDVATPWTGSRIFGVDSVARVLDAVEQNQVATRGVTVIQQEQSVIKVRQGLTTDMSNILTKLPTVVQIADEVQRRARAALDKFIGTKYLPGVTGQIESQLSSVMRGLQADQIIAAFTPPVANASEDDPTVAEVETYYQPVFPLLYIIATFNVRSSL